MFLATNDALMCLTFILLCKAFMMFAVRSTADYMFDGSVFTYFFLSLSCQG
jgi:hypothetical protein